MDYLPLFAAIKEKPVLVVGTGEIADRKIAFLQRAGAQVRVVAEADFDESQIDSVVLVIAANLSFCVVDYLKEAESEIGQRYFVLVPSPVED